MATLFGVVSRKDYPVEGWYLVYSPHSRLPMTGVSIKGTALSVGQQVAIVQSGLWSDERHGFGFAEVSAGIYSHVELTDTRAWVIDNNQIGASLAFLLHKAGRAEELYRPARVVAIAASTLVLTDWYTGKTIGAWPVASGLSAADFSVDDGVICRMIPSTLRRVEGWWNTVPSDAGTFYGYSGMIGAIMVINAAEIDFSNLTWEIENRRWIYRTDIEYSPDYPFYSKIDMDTGNIHVSLYGRTCYGYQCSIPRRSGVGPYIKAIVSATEIRSRYLTPTGSGTAFDIETSRDFMILFPPKGSRRVIGNTSSIVPGTCGYYAQEPS